MSDIDLTEAIEAARAAIENAAQPWWRFVGDDQHDTYLARDIAQCAVAAAASLIAAQVRAQIAGEIEAAQRQDIRDSWYPGLALAARIARGDAK